MILLLLIVFCLCYVLLMFMFLGFFFFLLFSTHIVIKFEEMLLSITTSGLQRFSAICLLSHILAEIPSQSLKSMQVRLSSFNVKYQIVHLSLYLFFNCASSNTNNNHVMILFDNILIYIERQENSFNM